MTSPEIETDGIRGSEVAAPGLDETSGAGAPVPVGDGTDRPAAIDRAVFADLLEQIGGGDDVSDSLIQTYLSDGADRMTELTAAVERGDAAAVARAAHGLRSGSALLGALGLAARLQRTETAVRTGTCDLRTAGGEIAVEYGRVAAALDGMRVSA
jgi:HPt (histidine-containing phosphotransfer) domain-containing protein